MRTEGARQRVAADTAGRELTAITPQSSRDTHRVPQGIHRRGNAAHGPASTHGRATLDHGRDCVRHGPGGPDGARVGRVVAVLAARTQRMPDGMAWTGPEARR